MEYLGLAFSLLAILFSLYTYYKHDAKIKEQSRLLNDFQIEKFKEEKSRKAFINADVIPGSKGSMRIRIYNTGQATARNVYVNIPEVTGIVHCSNPTPLDIRSNQGIYLDLLLSTAAPDFISIGFTWEDDFSKENKDSQTIQL